MRILYRPAYSMTSVYEALEQKKEFSTVEELLDFLVEFHDNAFTKEDLSFRYYSYDSRIDWNTYLVTTKRYGKEESPHGMAIAFITFK